MLSHITVYGEDDFTFLSEAPEYIKSEVGLLLQILTLTIIEII